MRASGADCAPGITRVTVPEVKRETGYRNPTVLVGPGQGCPWSPNSCRARAPRAEVEQTLSMELVDKVDRGWW